MFKPNSCIYEKKRFSFLVVLQKLFNFEDK